MQSRMVGVTGAILSSLLVAEARAQESGPAIDVRGRDACLSSHEQSQELKLEGKLTESKKALLSCAEEHCPSIVRADCLRWLDDIESAIPTIVVVAESDRGDEIDVRVTIDGTLAASQLDGKAIELDPGSHQIILEHNDAKPQVMRLILGQGEKNRIIRVDFRTQVPGPAPPTPMPTQPAMQPIKGNRPVPILTYVFGGTAAAALASTTYFGVRAVAARSDANNSCAPLCSGSVVNHIKHKALYSDLSTSVAVLSAAAAVVLYATRPVVSSQEKPSKLARFLEHWRFGASPEAAVGMLKGAF